ncbi:WAT1-related protein At3g30340-like isoform X3 [Camellia sinensis]|uniref:WAT1-related protein At3g30340-like isoform X3 n=1 Tax=Camellia sinensis TaxID=4442 RepID=UPI0010358F7B|nr:WAT1-related protein At3g30340-like isoform X3 [Camellia sinensis]
MAMGLFYYGLRDTTATYATNFLNLIPVATFVFSIIARMEKLRLRTKAGKVKTGGAIMCLAGALTISLYKGTSFYIGHHTTHHQIISHKANHHWTRGSLFLGFSVLSYATWFVVQGALATAASFCLISWTIRHRGPTYPSMFNPLALIFIAIAETLFLDEPITVGSLLGMLLIVSGLYSFLWGKNKESKIMVLPKAIFDETSLVVVVPDQSVVKQSTAVVMPSASTSISTIDAEDGADPNHGEVHGV